MGGRSDSSTMAGMPDTGTIAIDVGGTFTDITFADAGTGATWVAKTPSTPGGLSGGFDFGGTYAEHPLILAESA
jgi:Hydantoinase/oxoprolinase N-terminal region